MGAYPGRVRFYAPGLLHLSIRQPIAGQPRIPSGVWALGFVSLLSDLGSEVVRSLLPVLLAALAPALWRVLERVEVLTPDGSRIIRFMNHFLLLTTLQGYRTLASPKLLRDRYG